MKKIQKTPKIRNKGSEIDLIIPEEDIIRKIEVYESFGNEDWLYLNENEIPSGIGYTYRIIKRREKGKYVIKIILNHKTYLFTYYIKRKTRYNWHNEIILALSQAGFRCDPAQHPNTKGELKKKSVKEIHQARYEYSMMFPWIFYGGGFYSLKNYWCPDAVYPESPNYKLFSDAMIVEAEESRPEPKIVHFLSSLIFICGRDLFIERLKSYLDDMISRSEEFYNDEDKLSHLDNELEEIIPLFHTRDRFLVGLDSACKEKINSYLSALESGMNYMKHRIFQHIKNQYEEGDIPIRNSITEFLHDPIPDFVLLMRTRTLAKKAEGKLHLEIDEIRSIFRRIEWKRIGEQIVSFVIGRIRILHYKSAGRLYGLTALQLNRLVFHSPLFYQYIENKNIQ